MLLTLARGPAPGARRRPNERGLLGHDESVTSREQMRRSTVEPPVSGSPHRHCGEQPGRSVGHGLRGGDVIAGVRRARHREAEHSPLPGPPSLIGSTIAKSWTVVLLSRWAVTSERSRPLRGRGRAMTRCLCFRPGPLAFGHPICGFKASFYWSVSVAAALFNGEPGQVIAAVQCVSDQRTIFGPLNARNQVQRISSHSSP